MPVYKITAPFKMGSWVYVKHDPEQVRRMVIAMTINIGGAVIYTLGCGDIDNEGDYFEEELSKEKNVIGDIAHPKEDSEGE
jgi:hypothetical protein